MGFQAWNLFADPDWRRENQRDLDADDLYDAEAIELERAERLRYASEAEPFVIRGAA